MKIIKFTDNEVGGLTHVQYSSAYNLLFRSLTVSMYYFYDMNINKRYLLSITLSPKAGFELLILSGSTV